VRSLTIRTSGRTANAAAVTPRQTTSTAVPAPRFGTVSVV